LVLHFLLINLGVLLSRLRKFISSYKHAENAIYHEESVQYFSNPLRDYFLLYGW